MQRTAVYPGSCGEILQGKLMNRDLLLSCPINLFTKVTIYESKNKLDTKDYYKSRKLVRNLLVRWGHESETQNIDINIYSNIPKGKGFASSTADLCASYKCMISLFGRPFDIDELIEECIKIEPTDSIIFDKMTLFDYKKGRFYEVLGEYKEFSILVFEGNKIVDTVKFNSLNLPKLKDISEVLPVIREGIREGDILKISKASTISILKNQHRIRYEVMDEIINIMNKTGGLGIIGGHSGDVIGIIYDDNEKLTKAMKYKDCITGYKCYPLRTLRSTDYEDHYDYCTL